jgi:DNA primase
MIPIRDEQGRVIAFTGRTLSTDDQTAKYVNSPETPLFRKSHILFALDRARTALVESREAIICEGQIDVIRCHSAGFKSAVASQGTAFTEDHARILRRYVDSIVLVFDPDHAGQEAAIRTAGIFVQAGLSVRIARLPPKSDPDSFILTKGAAPFAAILKAASSAIDFLVDLNLEREDPHSEIGLRRIEKNLIEFLKLAPSAVQRDRMIESAGRRLQIHPDDLRRDLKAAERTFQRKSEPPPDSNLSPALPSLPEEIELAFYLAAHPELAELLDAHLPLHLIQDSQVRRFIEAVRISRQDQQPLMSVILDRDDADRSLGRFAADILSRPVKSTGDEASPQEIVEGLLMAIWRRELKRRRTKLEQTLLKADLDPDGRHEVETEIHRLTPEIKQLTRWETAVKTIAAHRAEE